MDSFLNFQDLNITIDQLDKDNIVYFDEDLMSRTLFIVSSKRCAHLLTQTIQVNKKNYFRYEKRLLEQGVKSVTTVEFKWMKDESLSEDFVKVIEKNAIILVLPCFVFKDFFVLCVLLKVISQKVFRFNVEKISHIFLTKQDS